MAIEIKELVIRAVVDYQEEAAKNADTSAALDPVRQEEIINACVRRVLQIINRSKQR